MSLFWKYLAGKTLQSLKVQLEKRIAVDLLTRSMEVRRRWSGLGLGVLERPGEWVLFLHSRKAFRLKGWDRWRQKCERAQRFLNTKEVTAKELLDQIDPQHSYLQYGEEEGWRMRWESSSKAVQATLESLGLGGLEGRALGQLQSGQSVGIDLCDWRGCIGSTKGEMMWPGHGEGDQMETAGGTECS